MGELTFALGFKTYAFDMRKPVKFIVLKGFGGCTAMRNAIPTFKSLLKFILM